MTYTPELRAELDAALRNIDAEIHLEGNCSEYISGDDISTWERGIIIDTLLSVIVPTIDAQAAEIARLREALKPFAEEATGWDADVNCGYDFPDHEPVNESDKILVGHLRAARAALAGDA